MGSGGNTTPGESRQDAIAMYLAQGPRYRLDIAVSGDPAGVNEYKDKFTIHRRDRIGVKGQYIPGGRRVITKYTPEAEAWMFMVGLACNTAVSGLKKQGIPMPVEWPTPWLLFVDWHKTKYDVANPLKATEDAMKAALGVDDREYRYRWLDRDDTKGPRGCSITILSGVLRPEAEPGTPAKRRRSSSAKAAAQGNQQGKKERPPHAIVEVGM